MIVSAWPACSPGEAKLVGQPPGLERVQAGIGIDRRFEDLLRGAGRHFFNLDAALGTGHEHREPEGAIQDHAEVDFAGDVGRFLNEHLGDLLSLGRRSAW